MGLSVVRYPLSVTFLFLLSGVLFSQEENMLQTRPRLVGGLSTRNTFIHGFNAPIISIKAGAEFQGKLRLGAGFCFLKSPEYDGSDQSPFIKEKYLWHIGGGPELVPAFLKLRYFCYFADYVYYKKKHWELSLPVQIGFGQSKYEYKWEGRTHAESEEFVFLYEPAIAVNYHVFRWLGLGAEVGYRFISINNKFVGNNFNSPIYDLKLMIFWGEVVKAIFPESRLSKKLGN
jgi:hypothetical protein